MAYKLPHHRDGYMSSELAPYLPELVNEIIEVLLPVPRDVAGIPTSVCRECHYELGPVPHDPECAIGKLAREMERILVKLHDQQEREGDPS